MYGQYEFFFYTIAYSSVMQYVNNNKVYSPNLEFPDGEALPPRSMLILQSLV